MARVIPERLLGDRITIRKPVQAFVAGTKKPVFSHEVIAANVKARFNPASTAIDRNVLGQTPARSVRVYVNLKDLPEEGIKENYEVVNEVSGETYVVTEVKNMFNHHLEAELSEAKS